MQMQFGAPAGVRDRAPATHRSTLRSVAAAHDSARSRATKPTVLVTKAYGSEHDRMSPPTAPTVMQFSGEFLELAVAFLVLAVVAYAVGARGIAGLTMEIARWLIVIFLVLALVSVVL